MVVADEIAARPGLHRRHRPEELRLGGASWCQQALVALPNAEPICAQSACGGCDACAAVLRLSTALEQAAALDLGSKPRRRLKLWPRGYTARARNTGPAIGNPAGDT